VHRFLPDLLVALAPAAGLVLWKVTGTPGVRGVYEGGLAALVLQVACGAFAAPRPGVALRRVVGGAGGAALVLLVLVAGGPVRPAMAFGLFLACGAAGYGWVSAGLAAGAPRVTSAAVALGVMGFAMTGLFWADRAAGQVAPASRYVVRQAVLDADPALAFAYGALDHDRMRDADVYATVPAASSLVRAPTGGRTALLWGLVGLVLGLSSFLLRVVPSGGGEGIP